MEKAITTKKSFKINDFKIVIGTVNKKNPETFYIRLKSFIEPITKKNKYSDAIIKLNNDTDKYMKEIIYRNNFSDKYIKTIDYSSDILEKKGKTCLEISIMFKQNNKLPFDVLYGILQKEFNNENNKFQEIFNQNNFKLHL